MDVEGDRFFSGESGPGSFKAEPGGTGEVGEGASSLLGWERLNGPTTGCVRGEAVAFASSPSLAGRGRRVAQGWGGPGAAGSREGWRGARPGWSSPPSAPLPPHSSDPPARGPAGVWVLAACQGAPGLLGVRARGAPDSWQLRAHSAIRGSCCALLACLSRVSLVNRPDLLPRLNA